MNRTALIRATAPEPIPLQIEWTRPSLYPAQEAAIFNDQRIVCVEASTKSGKTVGCLAWLVEQAMMHGRQGAAY
jgi:Rad3-related DNA helicase